jgi:hypothetical protein
MPRRRSGLQPSHLIGALAFLAAAGGGFWFFSQSKEEGFTGNKFSAAQYQQNYIGLRGNKYVVTGTITKQLRYAPDSARLFSLAVTEEGMSEPLDLAVLVPPQFSSINIQSGQEFQLRVLVDKDGLLRVEDIRKS